MASDLVLLAASGLAGLLAGLFLDVFGFLLLVVGPSLVAMVVCAATGGGGLSWWTYPTAWIVQQASYLLSLHLGRPAAYRLVLDRVRLMVER